jgi:cyanophycinase
MKFFHSTAFLFIALALQTFAQFGAPKGHLVIIGGGVRPEAIMKKIIALAGGDKARILIVPMASSEMLETAKAQREQFLKFGAPSVDYVICDSVSANADSNLAKINVATGVFFSGGDQNRLMAALRGTKFLEAIWNLYRKGGVLSGTSAGAAVQSDIMLTGDEAINKDTINPYGMMRKGNIITTDGFGFVRTAIVDQHFVKRKRQNRLLTLVLEHPELVGVGIDEATCIIVKPNNTFEVLGEATVQVFDARKAKNIRTDKNNNLAADDIRVSILPSGASYTLPPLKKGR